MTDKPDAVHIEAVGSEDDGTIVINLADEAQLKHQLRLSIFDVSTLVSALYTARADAMKQKPENGPEVMMPINGYKFGSDDKYEILRIYVTDELYQDFAAQKGTPFATALKAFSEFVAKTTGQAPEPFAARCGKKH